MDRRPGGEMAARPLHFIWIADCSGSMNDHGKIQALNTAIREAIPHMRDVADQNPNAEVLVRAVRFASGAQWHISQPTPVDSFSWQDLDADGVTDLGRALSLVAEQLRMPPMDRRALPPVLVLVSDGLPTDDWRSSLQEIRALPWGKKAVRIAIAIGDDAETDVLEAFIDNPELRPLKASNPEQLVNHIRWASTAVVQEVSQPSSQRVDESATTNVPIEPPSERASSSSSVIW